MVFTNTIYRQMSNTFQKMIIMLHLSLIVANCYNRNGELIKSSIHYVIRISLDVEIEYVYCNFVIW